MPANILLVEDHGETARLIAEALRAAVEPYEVTIACSARQAVTHLEAGGVDCLLLDYRLPDADGITLLRRVRREMPDVPVIMITGSGSEDVAVDAMKLGAADYVVKQGRYVRTVPTLVREVLGKRVLAEPPDTNGTGCAPVVPPDIRARYREAGLIGESPALLRSLVLAERAAHTGATVLIEGESGTGKELFARAIHARSARAGGPFLAQNCAALSETLLESELFGHTRGAFTGADRARTGLFEEAGGGTLFLDEVGEIGPEVQAKLLRVLQDKSVRPLGSSAHRRIDVRIIAATNRNLRCSVADGQFRLDLFHRLCVFPMSLPALRHRRADLRPLAEEFLRRFSAAEGKPVAGLSAGAAQCLELYSWPGNVRELENEMCRLVLCAEPGERIGRSALAPWIIAATSLPHPGDSRPLREIIREVETAVINARLRRHGYHRQATAKSLGITREALWAKCRALGVEV